MAGDALSRGPATKSGRQAYSRSSAMITMMLGCGMADALAQLLDLR